MVILPYKDRLALFSRYLQQLVMESLGKEQDREGKMVHRGVEAGKKAATELLRLQTKVREKLNRNPQTADQIARALGVDPEPVYHLLVHLHANDPTVQSAVEKEVAADKFFLA